MSNGNHRAGSRVRPLFRRKGLVFFLVAGSLLLPACSTTTKVGDILSNPAAYEGAKPPTRFEVTRTDEDWRRLLTPQQHADTPFRRKGLVFFLVAGSLLLPACSTTTKVGDILSCRL